VWCAVRPRHRPDRPHRFATVAAGIDELPEIKLEDVAEQDWVRVTQSQFDPIRVNDRL